MKLLAILSTLFASFIFTVQCSNNSIKEFSNKKIIIGSKETVKVKELDLIITNNGCGRKWIMNEKNKGGSEVPYCELVIKYKDSTILAGNNFDAIQIGDAEITIDRMNPWGVLEDSVPPGACRLWVKKLTD